MASSLYCCPEHQGLQSSKENAVANQGLELQPVLISASWKRWRTVWATLRSIRAFSLAGDATAENHGELSHRLLSPPSDTVIHITSECLIDLVQSKNIDLLHQFGGVTGVASALGTDAEKGIQSDVESIARRRQDFGYNKIHQPPPKVRKIVWETFKDPIIIILLVCAALSLVCGIKKKGLKGLHDGGSIFVAVFFVIIVTSSSNLWPRKQIYKLSKVPDGFSIVVIRNGKEQCIPVSEAVVGDVVCLKFGDQVPADGLYIDGNFLQVDESHLGAEMESLEVNDTDNPFLLFGTKVRNGSARMIVTAVGMNSKWGKILSTRRNNPIQSTPLQMKIHKLTILIAMVGLAVASMVFVILLIRYFVGNMHDAKGKTEFVAGKTRIHDVWKAVIGILVTPLAIASTAIPEGLLLAITITIAYSTKRMADQQALVRNLSACEEIGSTTVICTNERGTLTFNHLEVSEFWFGQSSSSSIAPNVLELLFEVVVLKDTHVSPGSSIELTERQIETAIQEWGQEMGLEVERVRANCTIHHAETSNSEKANNIWIQKSGKETCMYQKGEPEVILATCSHYYDEHGIIQYITDRASKNLEQKVQEMRLKGLQCIAFAHKTVSEINCDSNEEFQTQPKEEFFTLLGIVGLKYPCRPEAREAVLDCQTAGVNVKLLTRNELFAARATAIECGIIGPNEDATTGVVSTGPDFQKCTDEEKLQMSEKIRVMARASTLDKRCMVKFLRKKNHVVAITGDSIGDAAVLGEANVGLSLGIQGTDAAKENSDIIILDDKFDTVARVFRWGRGMYYKIQIYTQFQLTVSISSLVIDFVTAISAREPPTIKIVAAISAGKVPYAALQVLWVKLIVGTLAALALTIGEPPEELMQLPPVDWTEPLITNIMWRNIVGQALYPIITLLTIQFKGESTFNLDAGVKDTIIFNTLVLWQLYTLFNTRRFAKNILTGIERKKLFWTVIGIIILLQVVIVELLKQFADTKRLNWMQWAASVGIAILAWPIGWLVERIYVPKKPFFSFHSS